MGKGAGGSSQQYDYYGTIAGAICAGPVDELLAILIDGKIRWPMATAWASGTSYSSGNLATFENAVWKCISGHTSSTGNQPPNATHWTRYSVLRSASANPYPITVEGYGNAYLYWGTTSQSLDTTGEKILNDNGHPPYRRQAVLVLKDFLFGREKVSAPSVEVIVRRAPNQSVITGDPAALADGQANPVATLADLYTDPVYGAGLTAGTLSGPDATTWQSAATAAYANRATSDVSPVLLASRSLRDFTANLLAYYDGWLRFKTDGTIEAGAFSHASAPPSFGAATTIDYNDLVAEVEYQAGGWAETFNQTQVSFTDRERNFKDGAVSAVSGYNLQITSQPRTTKVDRPWITRRQQASDWAAEYQKINGEPKISGSLVIRAEKAESIKPGDLFLLTHDAVSVSIICRCLGKDIAQAPAGRATLRFENERALAPVPYQPTATALHGQAYTPNENLTLNRFFQPPASMIDGANSSTVVALVGRKKATTTGANVWLKKEEAGSQFYELATISNFGIKGTLQRAYGIQSVSTVSFSRASNTVTLTLASPLNIDIDTVATVTITGLSNSALNGTFFAQPTSDRKTIYYTVSGADISTTADTGGIVTTPSVVKDESELLRVTLDTDTNAADLTKMLATQSEDAIADDQIAVVVFDEAAQSTATRARASNVATIGFSTAHRFLIGQCVTIAGLGGTGFNGTWAIIDVPSATEIKFINTGSDVSSTSDTGGTATPYKTFEVMTLRSLRVVGSDTFYRLKVQRNRFGTAQRSFPSGSVAWIVYRADLVALNHTLFPSYAASQATATFRLQGVNAESTADLTDTTNYCPDISFTFFDANSPKITFTAVTAGGTAIADFTYSYASSTTFQVEATITDGSGDLVGASVFARLGSLEVPIFTKTFSARSLHSLIASFKLPSDGDWQIFATGQDATGAITTKQLTAPNSNTPVTIKVGVSAGGGGSPTTVATPTADPLPGGQDFASASVTLSCATSGATIKYAVARTGYSPGTYSTYTGPIDINVYRYGYTIWAYAEKSGLTTSPTVQLNYWLGN